MDEMIAFQQESRGFPTSRRERLTFLQTPSDLCLHSISKAFGLAMPPIAIVSACAAGADAVGTAHTLIAAGRRRWMLAGGTDSMINPLGLGGFCLLGAASTQNRDPKAASRPFDRRRDGFVLGEGAAVMVLERREDAMARGATVYGEILGYGNSFDAYGISAPHPEGKGAVLSMNRALRDAGRGPDAIQCVSAHATGTPLSDPAETFALKMVFGERAKEIPVYANKSMTGHLISASGAVEAVGALLCMNLGMLPPTINLDEPDPACDLDYVPNTARRFDHDTVLSNSFGFGGMNATLILGKGEAC
jgi:3-oxoacyl-[acyl-carrier-protein] synthase II